MDNVSGLGSHSISVIEPSFVSGYNSKPISGQSTVTSAVTGLSENTTYYYRVRASDGSASANSNVITVTTKQTPTVTPTVGTYTYTGSAQGPNAATNTGTGTSHTFSYSGTGTTTYGPSSTQPTAAGTYTVIASVSANGNYVAASSSATAFSIDKATPTITAAPTASSIVLGQALSASTLSGGTATPIKILGQIQTTGNTMTNVYVVPASTQAVVSTITVCNQSANNVLVDVISRYGATALGNQHYLVYQFPLGAADTLVLEPRLTMNATSVLAANVTGANAASNVSVNVFGIEVK
jgi:hypothetical protein